MSGLVIGEGGEGISPSGSTSDLSYAYKMGSLTQVDPQDLPDHSKTLLCAGIMLGVSIIMSHQTLRRSLAGRRPLFPFYR